MSLDRERFLRDYKTIVKETNEWIDQGLVMSIHPDWLFTSKKKTQRGAYYDALKTMLDVDKDLETLNTRKSFFVKVVHDHAEYIKSIKPTEDFLAKLQARNIDIFTFLERKWCCPITNPPSGWVKADDNVGLLEIKDYTTWWNSIGKKTRNMVRKAEKEGVKVSVISPSDELAQGIYNIYHETPIRQGRAFPHYGESLENIAGNMYAEKQSTFIGAYLGEELIGFIQIQHGDNIDILSNILSMQRHWDKSVNNALLAKAVEVCASRGEHWLMYGRIGNHPSLDKFKENNGFIKYPVSRYYVPLTSKGKLAIKLGLHRELKDVLPEVIKKPLIPFESWVSRTKVKVKMKLRNR